MTDHDIIERVAGMFGTSVITIDKGRFRTEYRAVIKGSRAVDLMIDLGDDLGARRKSAIVAAASGYRPPVRKLSFELAEVIRAEHRGGDSISELARRYEVRTQTIGPLIQGRIYREPVEHRWRMSAPWFPVEWPEHPQIRSAELCWLAGWLEGEGSFLRPPPSDPRRCRISAKTRDRDVIDRVGRSFGVSPCRSHDARAASHGWSPLWRILLAGRRASILMLSLRPLMSQRRVEQIDAAVASVMETGGVEPPCTVA